MNSAEKKAGLRNIEGRGEVVETYSDFNNGRKSFKQRILCLVQSRIMSIHSTPQVGWCQTRNHFKRNLCRMTNPLSRCMIQRLLFVVIGNSHHKAISCCYMYPLFINVSFCSQFLRHQMILLAQQVPSIAVNGADERLCYRCNVSSCLKHFLRTVTYMKWCALVMMFYV